MKTGGVVMETPIPMPENALIVTSQNGDDNIGFTSVTLVMYLDSDFDPEECEACNADDLAGMGGTYEFCAYRVEIPCDSIAVECGEPSGAPSGSFFPSSAPSDVPTKSSAPSDSPSGLPSSSPSSGPTGSPSSSPSSSPSDKPTASPSGSPSNSPSGSPSSNPSGGPSGGPTNNPSETPSEGPTALPSSGPSPSPSSSPSLSPTAFPTKSMMPTDCNMPAPPKVLDFICMKTGGEVMETPIPMPDNALIVTSQNGGDNIGFTVVQEWVDKAGMAIRIGMTDCIVKGNIVFGSKDDFEGECLGGVTSVTLVVFFDSEFDPEECEACNADDLTEMGGINEFCAYRVEIPCDTIAVECGEPSTAPSGSFFPKFRTVRCTHKESCSK